MIIILYDTVVIYINEAFFCDLPKIYEKMLIMSEYIDFSYNVFHIKKRAITFGHTEYIPAELQFGFFLLLTQWTIFGVLVRNYYIAVYHFILFFFLTRMYLKFNIY